MKISGKAVAKKRGKFFLGEVKDNVFKEERQINGIRDIDNPEEFVTLAQYINLMGEKYTKKLEKQILKEIGYTSIYLHDKPLEITESGTITQKAWNEFFFGHFNSVCVQCIHDCKQSSRVILDKCPDYTESNE